MIRSFACEQTRALFERERPKRLPASISGPALRKLLMIDAAQRLDELRVPPGNRLEPLKGNRAGQWSIRINSQWRVCFRWHEGDAHGVEIVDYH